MGITQLSVPIERDQYFFNLQTISISQNNRYQKYLTHYKLRIQPNILIASQQTLINFLTTPQEPIRQIWIYMNHNCTLCDAGTILTALRTARTIVVFHQTSTQ